MPPSAARLGAATPGITRLTLDTFCRTGRPSSRCAGLESMAEAKASFARASWASYDSAASAVASPYCFPNSAAASRALSTANACHAHWGEHQAPCER